MTNKEVIVWGSTPTSQKYLQTALKRGWDVNVAKDEHVIKDNHIFFYFQDSTLTSDGWFDTTKLFEMVDLWGYCFEQGISVTDKILVICCDTNPGISKRIHELLNPMNINVCFLPLHNSIITPPRLPIGTLNSWVVSKVSYYLNQTFFDDVHLFEMTSTTAELISLGLSQTKLSNNLSLINYKNTLIRNSVVEEYPMIESFLNYKSQLEYKEDILRNQVLLKYIDTKNIPNNVSQRVEDEKQKNLEFVIGEFLKSETPIDTEVIVDGICYTNSTLVDYYKHRVIVELLTLGYKVVILESEDFIRSKVPQEMINDFGPNVKFYKKGSQTKGYVLPL